MGNLKSKSKEKLYGLLGIIFVVFSIIRRRGQNPKVVAFGRIIVPFECILLIYILINSFMKIQSHILKIVYLILIIIFVIIFIMTIPIFLETIMSIF